MATGKATGRPKQSISRPYYGELCDVRLPRECKHQVNVQRSDSTIYRLSTLEEDESRGLVKISYIGYGSEWDEWRRREDIELDDEDAGDQDNHSIDSSMRQPLQMSPLNLYE